MTLYKEGLLRGRYVKQLAESEEQLAGIDRTTARLQADIEQKQADIEKTVSRLLYETSRSGKT